MTIMQKNIPELLAPAGSMEALKAAVKSGADAVYLGYTAFGARATAVNFDEAALREAVSFAHLYHTRVYVTVNTLIKPGEIPAVREALTVISDAGADAVLVQDLGVARIVRDEFPSLELHASTQMALCNAAGVRFAKEAGFRRVVLARECTLEEMRKAAGEGVEIEVFVHGALCTAVSGRCLMSSFSGGRSGNRGRCAQPCRQRYQLGDTEGALLSLRDLCLYRDLPALCETGVSSLKIEGRLKSPEYVAAVVSEYRKALDRIAGDMKPYADSESEEALLQIFNRGSFTRGHAMSDEDAALVTGDRVSHTGIPVGKVVSAGGGFASVLLGHSLQNEDSLQFHGKQDEDLRYSGPDRNAGETARIRLRPGMRVSPGDKVFRLTSSLQLEKARSSLLPKIPVSAEAVFDPRMPVKLTLSDGVSSVTASDDIPQPAVSHSATVEDAAKQLLKMGDTPFSLSPDDLTVQLAEGLFLPVSSLNALRRKAVEKLIAKRTEDFRKAPHTPVPAAPVITRPVVPVGPDTLTVLFSDPDIAEKLKHAGAVLPVFCPVSFLPEELDKALDALPEGTWLRLPPQMTEKTFRMTEKAILAKRDRIAGLWLESVSQLSLCPSLPAIAGPGIPCTNPEALRFLAPYGLSAHTVCGEWAENEFFENSSVPSLLMVYGRETVMLLNHCPYRAEKGLSSGRKDCSACRDSAMVCAALDAALRDRKGYRFPLGRVRFPEGCEIQVLNALPTELSAWRKGWSAKGFAPMLRFTDESTDTALSITAACAALLRGEEVPFTFPAGTSGHYHHSVE